MSKYGNIKLMFEKQLTARVALNECMHLLAIMTINASKIAIDSDQ